MLSNPLRFLCFLLCVRFLLPVHNAASQATDAATKAAAVAPFLDDQTVLVAHLNLRQVEPAEAVKFLARLAPPEDTDFPKQLARLEQQAKATHSALAASGVRELYAVLSMADFPKEPLFIVAPLQAGADSASAAATLRQVLHFEESDTRGNVVVLGRKLTIDRLKSLRPTPRPEFARGFERAGDAALQVVMCPSDDTRRVLREMLPRLPDEIGGGSGKVLADGLQWAALYFQFPLRPSLSLVVQSRDPESASALRGVIISAFQLLARQPEIRKQWPQVDDLARLLTPRLSGEQLLLHFTDQSGDLEQVLRLAIAPLQLARTAAGRQQSMNNLKHFGLALHNYHDTHRRLPPQAIRGKDGRALLSWRVAILPFLDASGVHKEFRLDEPWDSEHNKRLIEKMPAVFASPDLGAERIAQGLTSYVAPLSKQPPAVVMRAEDSEKGRPGDKETIFDRVQGTRFQDITDGTSNTIMVLEVNPQSAVPWTKPEDVVIDFENPTKDLRGQPNDGFGVLLGDGSARFLKSTLDAATLRRLLQMNDGEAIGQIH